GSLLRDPGGGGLSGEPPRLATSPSRNGAREVVSGRLGDVANLGDQRACNSPPRGECHAGRRGGATPAALQGLRLALGAEAPPPLADAAARGKQNTPRYVWPFLSRRRQLARWNHRERTAAALAASLSGIPFFAGGFADGAGTPAKTAEERA